MDNKTPNLGLYLTPQNTEKTFLEFRTELCGDGDSNMTKIDAAFGNMGATIDALKSFTQKIYGVTFTGSSPTGTRTDDAEGLTANVGIDDQTVENDFDSIYPWSNIRRCNGDYNANGDFVVSAYEGEPGYAVDGTNGNVWVEIPQFWVQEEVSEDLLTETKRITPYEVAGFRLPEKFIKLNGDRRGKAYIAAYESGKVNGIPVSYSGVDVSSPAWSHNNFLTACKTKGEGYCAYTMEDLELISFLFQIEFATRNTQSIMSGATAMTTTAVDIAEATTSQNYVLVDDTVTYFDKGRPIKLHTTANSAAGDYHIVSLVTKYYAKASPSYEAEKSYFTRSGESEPYSYEPYEYSEDTWSSTYDNLYYETSMKKVVLEENASVTTTTATKIYCCPFKSGYTDNVVASSGAYTANNGLFPIKYRGIENPWGNVWKVMSGVLVNEYQPYVSKDAANDPTNSSAASIISSMTALNYTCPTANGYAKTMGYDKDYPTYRFTAEIGASSSTYYSDYYYQAAGVRCFFSGGNVHYGTYAGLFYFHCSYTPSHTSWNISSRLSYTG